ncbi:DMT family transporter [Chamaesiphon minutus]|uniref:Putative permease n=1 Tax=Chamaesiphon minutus (strain ATCC 27169 / PCC 6605) TaxID=1173020 RepID=K9UQA3_CHAP6|nr:DMT family transporter [Chamaesiphon minutus]AFY96631.1 putative permease [Chamaesiphon minutus PCC 6605]
MELHRTTGNWRLGLGLSLVTVILWGLVPVAIAIVLKKLDVYTINWFRFATAFILLGFYLFRQENIPKFSQLRSVPIYLFAIAILGLMGNYIFFVMGLKATSPSHAEVVIQLAGVFLSLGGLIIFKERYTRYQWLGVGILLAGFIGFFSEQLKVLAADSDRYINGSIMLVIAGITWAIYALIQKQLLTKLESAHIMWVIYGVCGLLFWTVAKPQTLLDLNSIEWMALIFCGLNTVIAYGAFAESLQHWEASRVSAILALAPIFTIVSMSLTAWLSPGLVTPEHITALGFLGAILVVVGSMSISLGKS